LIGLGAWLLIIPVASSLAQAPSSASNDYARALYARVYPNWANDSYSNDLKPDTTCAARIVQMPGGQILTVDILPDCAFGKESQEALVKAVHQATPLPYFGYESVFQREIRMVFHAASAEERRARIAAVAESKRTVARDAEQERQWTAQIEARIPYDKYVYACSSQLQAVSDKIRFAHLAEVMVTVAKSGKVVAVDGVVPGPLDKKIVATFMPLACAPIPNDVATIAGAVKVGPISINNWDPEPPLPPDPLRQVSRGTCHDASGNICHD
jgi:hypothetical protein